MGWEESQALRGRPEGLEIFSTSQRAANTMCPPEILQGDLLQLHWVARAIDFQRFFASIPEDFPIVWTLHDMNPFTGGCHYSGDCEAYVTQCRNCPQLARPSENDLSSKSFGQKLAALTTKTNLHIVAPSRWLLNEARRSRVLQRANRFKLIPYGLDTERLVPKNRSEARRKLGWPNNKIVIAFGAADLENRRKGMKELLAALSLLVDKHRYLAVLFGGGRLPSGGRPLPDFRSIGFISDPHQQALVYSASDMVVVPSLEDNLPQTGLEAMACGTPVVGFHAGGIPDYVLPGETGLLAQVADEIDLARQISWLADHPEERRQFGQNAHQMVRRRMTYRHQAEQYLHLYESILQERMSHAHAGQQAVITSRHCA